MTDAERLEERRASERRVSLRRVDDELADRIEELGLSRRQPPTRNWYVGRRSYRDRRSRVLPVAELEGKG